MKRYYLFGIWNLMILGILIPRVNYESTSYAKIEKANNTYELLFMANSLASTTGVVVWNNEIEQEEIYVWGLDLFNLFDEFDGIEIYYPLNISDDFSYLLSSGGHVEEATIWDCNIEITIEDVNGFDHIFVWGANNYGILGSGEQLGEFIYEPVEITENFNGLLEGGGDVESFDIGLFSSMAVIEDVEGQDHVFTWGSALTNGSPSYSSLPKDIDDEFVSNNLNVLEGGEVIDGSLFLQTTIIAFEDKNNQDYVFSWGDNNNSQAGTNGIITPDIYHHPLEITDSFSQDLNNGYHITSLEHSDYSGGLIMENSLQQQNIYFWGLNNVQNSDTGIIGWGEEEFIDTPAKSNELFSDLLVDNYIIDMKTNRFNTMVLFKNKNDGHNTLMISGENVYGQLGAGDSYSKGVDRFINTTENFPILFEGGTILSINAESNSEFAVIEDSDGTNHLYGWGDNSLYQLCLNETGRYFFPVELIKDYI